MVIKGVVSPGAEFGLVRQRAASRSLHFIFPPYGNNSNSLIAALDLHYDPRNSKIGATKKFVDNGFHQSIESAKLKRQVRLNNEKNLTIILVVISTTY